MANRLPESLPPRLQLLGSSSFHLARSPYPDRFSSLGTAQQQSLLTWAISHNNPNFEYPFD
jgi:hypothetical protein